ncbi:MAG: copper chaperone PCu(A)C [Caldilineaceae bacterium]|nr:copper chaperone PCu(A)C [Caldilineaceae bacterium]
MLVVAVALTACVAPQPGLVADQPPAPIESGVLAVDNVRANMTLPSETGSVWMVIANGTDQDETLLGAEIDGCDLVQIHEMAMKEGVMTMREVEGGELLIPAGEKVELKQGGLHIMCMGKAAPLEVGAKLDIALEFENAGIVTVSSEVVAPGEMAMGEMAMGDHAEDHEADHDAEEADAEHDDSDKVDDDHVTAIIPNDGATIRIVTPADGETVNMMLAIQVETEGFDLMAEGNHWHLYIDDELVEKVKGSAESSMHRLTSGQHEVRVAMSTAEHEEMADGDSISVTVP